MLEWMLKNPILFSNSLLLFMVVFLVYWDLFSIFYFLFYSDCTCLKLFYWFVLILQVMNYTIDRCLRRHSSNGDILSILVLHLCQWCQLLVKLNNGPKRLLICLQKRTKNHAKPLKLTACISLPLNVNKITMLWIHQLEL